jgi:hypothetical protein
LQPTGHRRREIGLQLAATAASARPPAATTTTGSTALAPELLAAMFATRCPTPAIAVKLTVGVQIVRFQVAIDGFTPGASGAAPGGRLDHHKWGVVLLRNLCRR